MPYKKPKNIVQIVLSITILLVGFALVFCLIWGGYRFVIYAVHVFSSLDRNIAAAIIAASATIIASTIAIVLSKHYELKKERAVAHRDKKVGLYDEFLKELFDIFLMGQENKSPEDQVPFLREIQRKIILWSGPEVIKSYALWHKEMTLRLQSPRAKSMMKMIEFFLALRKDLGHSNKGLKREYLLRFMLKYPDLFMKLFRENPDVTLTEIAKAEKEAGLVD